MTNAHPDNGESSDRRQPDCGFAVENAEAFALGALDGRDNSRMEQHLIWCGPCRRAVAEARRVTDLLPLLAEPASPSPDVKSALFARIAREGRDDAIPQLNPWVPASPTPASPASPSPTTPSVRGGWQRWLPAAVVAPLAIALLIVAAWANSLRNEVEYLEGESREPVTMASGENMQLYSMNSNCPTCNTSASGHFGGDPDGSVGVVVAWNLDPDEQHQVWCIDRDGEKWMVTDLNVEPTGDVVQTISFPQPLGGYQQIFVARHNGTADPDAELMVAMDGAESENDGSTAPPTPADT